MADPYERAKGGKLAFKGGGDPFEEKRKKKRKKKQKLKRKEEGEEEEEGEEARGEGGEEANETGGDVYTIDAAKRLKYDQLFPVEAKKFGYGDPSKKPRSVEDALDDRVKKKADRYCK